MIDFILNNYQQILSAVSLTLSALIAISMLIPGDQPEKTLKVVVDFIAKFSKK